MDMKDLPVKLVVNSSMADAGTGGARARRLALMLCAGVRQGLLDARLYFAFRLAANG